MSKRSAERNLNSLADVREQIAALEAERNEKLAAVLTLEQVQQQTEIEQAYAKKLSPLQQKEGDLIEKIKTAVLKIGETVRIDGLMAVWSKGSTKWNTDKLEGYAVEHQEILQFSETGSPSISIRKVK